MLSICYNRSEDNEVNMPLTTRKNSTDSGGDSPVALARSLVRPRLPNSASVLPCVMSSLNQRDVFTITSSSDDEMNNSTPRRSNKRRTSSAMNSIDDTAPNMMTTLLASSAKKRRKISDDTTTTPSISTRDPPLFSRINDAITQPGPNDVMYGRGGDTNAHIGNQKFRYIVESLKSKYSHAPHSEKSSIAMDIVSLWRKLDPPGRFLKQHDEQDDGEERDGQSVGGTWYDVGDKEAKKKTSQTLRDAANELVANYIQQMGKNEAELLQVCVEYLQSKTPGSGEVVDPLVLLSRKNMTQQLHQNMALQVQRWKQQNGVSSTRLTSTAGSTYPVQSIRGADKLSPASSAVHQDPSELEVQQKHQVSFPSTNNRGGRQRPTQGLTPKVVGEIFASLSSNKGCKHDFSIIILGEKETTIMPPFLQYSGTFKENTFAFYIYECPFSQTFML